MEGSVLNQQRTFRTYGNVFWNVQLSRNIPINDGRHIQRPDR